MLLRRPPVAGRPRRPQRRGPPRRRPDESGPGRARPAGARRRRVQRSPPGQDHRRPGLPGAGGGR